MNFRQINRTIGYTVEAIDDRGRQLFWMGVMLFFALLLTYGFLFQAMIRNVVERGSIERQMTEMTSQIGDLEYKQSALKTNLTDAAMQELGYVQPKDKVYVSRKKLAQTTSGDL